MCVELNIFNKCSNSLIELQMKNGSILIADKNVETLVSLKSFLAKHIEKVATCSDYEMAKELATAQVFDVVLLDISLSKNGNGGNSLHQYILKNAGGASVLILTENADVELAIAAVNEGAVDFHQKQWDNHKLLNSINTCFDLRRQALKLEKLKQQQQGITHSYYPTHQYIGGKSIAMKQVVDSIQKVAKTNASVLLLGENGTGKSSTAVEIHRLSNRKNEPFISIDFNLFNENNFDSELFGYVKDAFADAHENRVGRIEAANNGTLFLNGVENLSLSLQAKLLTALQAGHISRVGAAQQIAFDIRIIAASNQPIQEMVASGKFREDLFHMMNTVQLSLPPLRERAEDLPELILAFLPRMMAKYGKPKLKLAYRAIKDMEAYSWPGNIRELQLTLEKATILSDGKEISANDLGIKPSSVPASKDVVLSLESVEKITIADTLKRTKGNLSKTARLLGITRPTLYKKMEKYDI